MIATPSPPVLRRLLPGDATAYFDHGVGAGDLVVLVLRVSHFQQDHVKKHTDAERQLRAYCRKVGAIVVDVVRIVGSGWWNQVDAWRELRRAIELAREHDAKLFAESTDRFIRHPDFHSQERRDRQASERDLIRFRAELGGVRAATLLHPNASTSDVTSHQTKRGQTSSGPGYKKRLREEWKPQVIGSWRDGMSLRQLAAEYVVSKSTIEDWLKGVERHPEPPVTDTAPADHPDDAAEQPTQDIPPRPDVIPPKPTAADFDGDWDYDALWEFGWDQELGDWCWHTGWH